MTNINEKPSDLRILDAILHQWEQVGGNGVSVRQIAALAQVPVSSLYHHFGSLEQLLALAQQQAQADAERWCADWLGQINGFPADRGGFAGFFAALVDDWAQAQRRMAFAWREGQLLRMEGGADRALRQRWLRLWTDFWQEVAARFALEPGAPIALRLFENESFFHMMRWRRAVDRAGLDELAQGVESWMRGTPVPCSPWRDFARAQALAAAPAPPDLDDITARICAAASALIEQAGPGALTHRAVAERADLTLGVVSHKFRTKAELLEAAFEAIYIDAVTALQQHLAAPADATPARTVTGLVDFLTESLGGRGGDALNLAVARDPTLARFGLQLRYMRGAASRSLLAMLRPRATAPNHLEAALMSAFLSSLARAHVDDDADAARAPIQQQVEQLIALL